MNRIYAFGGALIGALVISAAVFGTTVTPPSTPGFWAKTDAGIAPSPAASVYIQGKATLDGGVCFHDGTCQTTAATAGASYWVDAGAGSIGYPHIARVGDDIVTDQGGARIQASVAVVDTYAISWSSTDEPATVGHLESGGGSVELSSSSARNVDLSPGGAANTYFRADPNNLDLRAFVPLDMVHHQVNNLAAGTASTDAVNLGQLPSAVVHDSVSGSGSPSRLVADYSSLAYPLVLGAAFSDKTATIQDARLVYLPGSAASDKTVTWAVVDENMNVADGGGFLCTFTDTKGCTTGTFSAMKVAAPTCSGTLAANLFDIVDVRVQSADTGCNPGFTTIVAHW